MRHRIRDRGGHFDRRKESNAILIHVRAVEFGALNKQPPHPYYTRTVEDAIAVEFVFW